MGTLLITYLCEKLALQVAFEADGVTQCVMRANFVCYVPFMGLSLLTSNFTLLVSILMSIVQALVLVPLSGFADLADHRRYLLLLFTLLGGTASCLHLIPTSFALYSTTFLSVISALSTCAVSAYALSLVPAYAKEYGCLHKNLAATEISSRGGAISLVCSTVITSLAYVITGTIPDEVMGIKTNLALGGAWWLAVGGGSWQLLSAHDGNKLPPGLSALMFSLKSVGDTMRLSARLSNLFLAQLAFFLISEGTNTSGLITIIVASNELNLSRKVITIITVATPLGCSVGIMAMLSLTKKFKLNFKYVMITMSLLTTTVISLNVIGYYTNSFGLKSKWEVIGAFIASSIFYGPVLVSFRILLAEISPKGRECQLFTFNTLLSTGTTWIGSAVVMYIINVTGQIRLAGYLPLVLVLSGVLVLTKIDLNAARLQAELYATS
ncbi:Autophagy protein 22 [Entomophthora muscae]|uniref:Autophagy protein 22 n=1 Tax=Entomophthora muscae TaxID=34485 RepID=A0ACC2TJ12_9FUNG|nr:Autophagy protein 22 [Entomophthora muscae]